MAQVKLKGLSKLATALKNLQAVSEEIREKLEEKQSWWDEKSEKWQQSDIGEEWEYHINEMIDLLDDIDNLSDVPE